MMGALESGRGRLYLLSSYEVYSAYLYHLQELAARSRSLDVGANQLKFGGAGDTGLLVPAACDRELTVRSSISLRASQEYQNTGNRSSGPLPDGSLCPDSGHLAAMADPLTRILFGGDYNIQWSRTTFKIGASLSSQDYENEACFETEKWRADLELTRELGESLDRSLRLESWDRESDQQPGVTGNRALLTPTYFAFER